MKKIISMIVIAIFALTSNTNAQAKTEAAAGEKGMEMHCDMEGMKKGKKNEKSEKCSMEDCKDHSSAAKGKKSKKKKNDMKECAMMKG